MSQSISGDRYVLYLPPAVENLDRLDNSLATLIEQEISKFLDIWNPSQLFDKPVFGGVMQIKKDRSVMRAFATWWDGGDVHVLLVVAVYKKKSQDDFWDDKREYNKLVQEYIEELTERQESGELTSALDNLENDSRFRLIHE